ncbi:pyruvate dehydrogenase E1 component alpha subunit [Ceratobasidium sp. AG-Ba]|nr:pyruvate dehydrogenase E1 component alpha subunit [Ceratobasidium sp. AG-Ba]QRW15091.1 pyruvate dehydrogenase E1 component alpha subunit [Ceratobasidium sp. AG-Ba]
MNRLVALRLPRRSQLPRQLIRAASSNANVTAATTPQPARHGHLPGDPSSAITTQMHFFNSVLESNSIPTYRVLDGDGAVINGAEVPEIDREFARRIYENMMLLPALDTVLYNVQRQGKISFYMTSYGEEASVIGSAAALSDTDEVLGQYREMGVLLWRNFGINRVMAQCFGNEEDESTKGRQMPVHFSSPDHHFHTISSPLATQIPQAAGVAYALKRDPARRGKDVAVCYFGDGAASEGDFHAGLGMASVLGGPSIFICRNNGFAISTPTSEQYAGDGIASRGPGYGMDTIRVDGNDVLAVLGAVREARRRALSSGDGGRAVLVECMSYRVGHHSTSDDSFAYRAKSEVENWKKIDNPHHRFRKYMESRDWWSKEDEEALRSKQKRDVMEGFKKAEAMKRPPLNELFNDLYGEGTFGEPWTLTEQRAELKAFIDKYGTSWEPYAKELAKFAK